MTYFYYNIHYYTIHLYYIKVYTDPCEIGPPVKYLAQMQQGVHSNPAIKKGKTIGNFLKNAKYAPQPTANFLKIVENDSSHQNNRFRLIKTALNNLGEMERRTIEGKFSYHSCIISTSLTKHNLLKLTFSSTSSANPIELFDNIQK